MLQPTNIPTIALFLIIGLGLAPSCATDGGVCGEPGTPPCDDQTDNASGDGDSSSPDLPGCDAYGLCCLCGVPGAPPTWCGPQLGPQVETAEACAQLGVELLASSAEWHEECVFGQPCPGACE